MKQYRNLLPAYLQGQNIERHAEILETQDNLLYDNMLLLMTMFDLNRPVLIEKVQEEPATCTMNVYVNTQYPIKRVKVTGDAGLLIEYDEEDRKLQECYSFTCTDTYPAVSPALSVIVETYDDEEYVKAYPENDEIKGNKNDHDIFLDRIGALLGIPRRVYTEQNIGQTVSEYLKLYPHFFTKQGYGKRVGEAYTEDDYYYHKRLIKFITERGQKPLPVLMSELLYEWTDVNYSNLLLRETSISEDLTEYVGQPILQIINNEEKYTNMDYTDMQNIISEYNMITRPLLLTDKREAWNMVYLKEGGVSADVHETFTYPNLTRLEVESWWQSLDGSEDGDLYNAPFTLEIYNHKKDYTRTIGRYTTGDNAKTTINLQGIPTGDMTFIARPVEEYEYKFAEESRLDTTIDSSFYAGDLNWWTGGQYQGTPISQLQQPFFNHDDLLSVGRRYLCALPVIDPRICDLSSYYVSVDFRYTHNYQKLGVVNVRRNADGTYTQTTAWITPYTIFGGWGNYDDVHTLEADWVDGTMYYYVDGEYTGISQNWNNRTDMIYLAGYNINETTNGNNVGLYIDPYSTQVQDESAYGSSPEYEGGGYSIASYMDTSKWTMEDFSEDEIIERTVDGIRELYIPEGEFEENICYCEIPQSTEYHFNITFRIDSQRSKLYITNDLCISTSLKAYTNARKWETFPQFVFEVGKWYNLSIILQNNGQLMVNGQNITLHSLFKMEYSLMEGVSIREYTVATKNTQQ